MRQECPSGGRGSLLECLPEGRRVVRRSRAQDQCWALRWVRCSLCRGSCSLLLRWDRGGRGPCTCLCWDRWGRWPRACLRLGLGVRLARHGCGREPVLRKLADGLPVVVRLQGCTQGSRGRVLQSVLCPRCGVLEIVGQNLSDVLEGRSYGAEVLGCKTHGVIPPGTINNHVLIIVEACSAGVVPSAGPAGRRPGSLHWRTRQDHSAHC